MSVTAAAPVRVEQMAVVHRVFRRGFPDVARLVRRTPAGASGRAAAVAAHLDFLLGSVRHHHRGEEELIWPLLLQRAEPQAELINRMDAQHAEVAARCDRLRSLLADWRESARDAAGLAQAIDEFSDALNEHLDDEEAHVVPLIRAHITAQEWDEFGQKVFEKFTKQEKLTATGVLEDVATTEEASWFTAGLPVFIKVMWRFVGRRRYARYMARVRCTARTSGTRRNLLRTANRVSVGLYRRSGGKIAGSAKGLPVLLLTVMGRRSGTPHTVPVAYIARDGAYLVMGSSGGAREEPQWFRNIRSAQRVLLEIGHESLEATVLVPDAALRDRLWHDVVLDRAPFFEKYQEKAGRLIPIAVLTPN